MKLKRILFLFIAAALSALTAVVLTGAKSGRANALDKTPADAAESITAKISAESPVFYGATDITFPAGAVDKFSVSDPRFRIFARDAFGLDLTPDIRVLSSNVDANKAGGYSIKYEVTDARGNRAEITVPVTVAAGGDEFIVERTVYAVPAMENMRKIGLERCNAGDRQILGIYAPDDSSFYIQPVDNSVKYEITFFTDNRGKNSFKYVAAGETEYKEINNLKNGAICGAVPLITSPRLSDESTTETFKIRLKFDSSVKPLDYYHYKDDEESFKSGWKSSENSFGVVDGEAMLVVVPLNDIDKLTGEKTSALNVPFSSLDEFFEYYKEVVNRFDRWAGLSFTPKYETDRNYRVKYTAIADSYGATVGAAAYYGGGFIATGSASVAGFFRYGWGTLHEIAHGYQGAFGRGAGGGYNMCLNETGNNIFAYYIQNDRSLFKGGENWMGGDIKSVEDSLNKMRLEGKSVFNNDGGTYTNVKEKLYCLINLFGAFDGAETYGKLFSYYRRVVARGDGERYTVPDVYAEFFATEYAADVTPYLLAWGMRLTPELTRAVRSRNLTAYYIPDDILGKEKLSEILSDDGFTLKYAPQNESAFERFNALGDLTVKITADKECFNELKNKNAGVFFKGELIAYARIAGEEVGFKNLKAGAYEVRLPALDRYASETTIPVTVKSGETALFAEYALDDAGVFFPLNLTIRGVHGTVGFNLNLSSADFAKVTLGGADLGNRNDEWKNKPDEVYASVTVSSADGSGIEKYEVKGNGYFSDLTGFKSDLNLTVGAKISVYTNRPQGVKVFSAITGEEISAFSTTDKLTEYEVTDFGLKVAGGGFDEKEALYAANKGALIKIVGDYESEALEQELSDKTINAAKKREVYKAYSALNDEDKSPYSAFMARVLAGGSPVITVKGESHTVESLSDEALYGFITVTDNEDFVIVPSKENTNVKVTKFGEAAGEYLATFRVYDSDGNFSEANVFIINSAEVNAAAKHSKQSNIYAVITLAATLLIISFGVIKAVKNIIKEG